MQNQFQDIIEEYPELKEKTIQQGDIYAIVCGEKEPRGRVRGLGLGPTPQDVGAPGLKSYAPTRLQMEVLARKKAESYNAVLEQRIVEMLAEKEEERMARHDVEIMSQNGSNSRAQTQVWCYTQFRFQSVSVLYLLTFVCQILLILIFHVEPKVQRT